MNDSRAATKCRARPTGRTLGLLVAALLLAGCPPDRERDGAEDASGAWFTEITDESGLSFAHESGATGKLYMPEIMGSGCAMFDADGDGDLDLYLLNGNRALPGTEPQPEPTNRFFRHDDGGRFTDRTAASGLGDGGYGMGVAIADYDNDGDLDVYVTNRGLDQLYENQGDGTFRNVTSRAGVAVDGWSSSAAFFDYDRDGWLDLYVARYVAYDPTYKCYDQAGRPDYCSKGVPPVADVLLHNEGDGTFADVSAAAGMTGEQAAGLGVVCADFDEDGWQDVYVANDAYPNHLWLNRGDGTFREVAMLLGAAFNLHGQHEAGMGVVAADFDQDADLDLFMTHNTLESNTLYENLGQTQGFRDVTGRLGLAASSMRWTGFGTAAFDIELDGDLDLVIVNGRVIRGEPAPDADIGPPWDRYAEPNLLYLAETDGRFTLHPALGGTLCGRVEVSRGLAVGDLDDDGDLDLLMTNTQGPARLYRNDAPQRGRWLIVRAIDPRLNRDAIGARVTVLVGGRPLVRTIGGAFSYLSSNDARAHFGLGDVRGIDRLEVRWIDGLRERFDEPEPDRVIELRRGEGVEVP